MDENVITINGVEYIPIDTPCEDSGYSCVNCDILKARPPQHMCQKPLCCDEEYLGVNLSCCIQGKKGINRIWKIKSVELLTDGKKSQ